jgi:hypothetical protein
MVVSGIWLSRAATRIAPGVAATRTATRCDTPPRRLDTGVVRDDRHWFDVPFQAGLEQAPGDLHAAAHQPPVTGGRGRVPGAVGPDVIRDARRVDYGAGSTGAVFGREVLLTR